MNARPLGGSASAVGAAVVLALGMSGCAGSTPSAPAAPPPPVVVPGPASAYVGVILRAGARRVELSAAQRAGIAPLVAARSFLPPEQLSAYGLDPPDAELVYESRLAPDITVEVGAPGFDAHFVYVMLPGGRSVFTVASAELRPLLALVGVSVPQPTG